MKRRGLLATLFGGTLMAKETLDSESFTVQVQNAPVVKRPDGTECQKGDRGELVYSGDWVYEVKCSPGWESGGFHTHGISVTTEPGVVIDVEWRDGRYLVTGRLDDE